MLHVSYLNALIPAQFKITVKKMAALILEKYPKCNLVFGRGLSGAMIVPALAADLGIDWGIVRKNDGSHSNYKAEFSMEKLENEEFFGVFIDDLIDSGSTLRESVKAVEKRFKEVQYIRGKINFTLLGAAVYDGRIRAQDCEDFLKENN